VPWRFSLQWTFAFQFGGDEDVPFTGLGARALCNIVAARKPVGSDPRLHKHVVSELPSLSAQVKLSSNDVTKH
jgi:hypothetical protein